MSEMKIHNDFSSYTNIFIIKKIIFDQQTFQTFKKKIKPTKLLIPFHSFHLMFVL